VYKSYNVLLFDVANYTQNLDASSLLQSSSQVILVLTDSINATKGNLFLFERDNI